MKGEGVYSLLGACRYVTKNNPDVMEKSRFQLEIQPENMSYNLQKNQSTTKHLRNNFPGLFLGADSIILIVQVRKIRSP